MSRRWNLPSLRLAAKRELTLDDLLALHGALMRHTSTPELGGQIRTVQNWIGGNDYNPCGAVFCASA